MVKVSFLVSGQQHIKFPRSILKHNLCKLVLCNIMSSLLFSVGIAVIMLLVFLIISNIVSLTAVPITHQETIMACRVGA